MTGIIEAEYIPADAVGTAAAGSLEGAIQILSISCIRQDGNTQCRSRLDAATVERYAEALGSGNTLPPISVWFDGDCYWLSDGFHRVAAAAKAGQTNFAAVVHHGTLSDALWDSCKANATHGKPWTREDILVAVRRALSHPNAKNLSHRDIARHLGIPQPSIVRYERPVSDPNESDALKRVVRRNQRTYEMSVHRSRGAAQRYVSRRKTFREQKDQMALMKQRATPRVRALLNIFSNWFFGTATADDCLHGMTVVCGEAFGESIHTTES